MAKDTSHVQTLNLAVKLHKVKSHSDDAYNDQADILAKGLNETLFSSVNPLGLESQTCTVVWSNEFTINRNIRKSVN